MTMHKAFHPREDVDRLYVSRKEGEKGLVSIEYSVDASTHRLEDYIEKQEGVLYIDLRPGQTCHSKDAEVAYSIGVGRLG